MTGSNLFDTGAARAGGEVTETLAGGGGLRVERILSLAAASTPGFWYDQAEEEWVAVIAGRACLEFADGSVRELGPGDHLLLPAGLRHRVAWTDPDVPTIWLAVFWPPAGA